MARLPQTPARRTLPALPQPSHYGRLITQAMLALMLLGMLCTAVFVRQSSAWLLVEDVLFLQFAVLILWTVLSRRRVF